MKEFATGCGLMCRGIAAKIPGGRLQGRMPAPKAFREDGMSKTIKVKLIDRSPEYIVHKAKTMAGQNGLKFIGDTQTGHFHGRGIEGRYHFGVDSLSITIIRKPIILPWALVETTVAEFFG